MYQNEFNVHESYVVYLHFYHMKSCSPTPTSKWLFYGCQPDQSQASLATTNWCNHVYVVLFFILLFMYAILHCLYPVGNKITTTSFGLGMRQECRGCFPRHWLQMKPLVSDPGMHLVMCVTHVPWCISESLTYGGEENITGIPAQFYVSGKRPIPWQILLG